MSYIPSDTLAERAARGELQAVGRLISRAEAGVPEVRPTLAAIYRRTGAAHVIGITGVAGSGKSTLVAGLALRLRQAGDKVGIVAIDPSSPYSGGSILGDRIRMSELAADPGIFIRSMATRGALGGMARATLEAVDILDLAGFDAIIIETVGVGQDEVEIARASHTTIVVSAPGLGDGIQAIKAGTLEIADIHVVSKCDRSDADRTLMDLKQMLMLGHAAAASTDWQVPVIGVSAYSGEGIDALVTAITRHRAVALRSAAGQTRRLAIADFRLRKTAENLLAERFAAVAAEGAPPLARRLADRDADPYTLARELVANLLAWESKHE
ncbi:methylmalonyl Co-A mutase-associated GTPase MeaB [Sedimenticola hydrogenitrophicus]|uniref:methylmalonyl Co-A mutase-associated GTPase MeaB n=1 Tax=Sedimenticola hydrogenitrophicus TaxID=2967975 RepID=UPI0021A69E10|nr:methylmalonyl Co-A mutase-associated GTPase MeaB [Sedimenticola hydrogenitrophicus]